MVEGPLAVSQLVIRHAGRRRRAVITAAVHAPAVSISKHGAVMSNSHVIRCRMRSRAAEPPVAHQHRHRHSARLEREPGELQRPVLLLALALVPPILEPDLDLRGGEFEDVGQVISLRRGQVALLSEAPLQLGHLGLGEENPGLPADTAGSHLRVFVTVRWTVQPSDICTSQEKGFRSTLNAGLSIILLLLNKHRRLY